ncbi:MAG TPA: phosphoenolpyruvate carboxylase, partial [Fodinibius sp.]|nr:phosphoenolpyruvate carboxylase [Fodinibius sp.]
MHWKNLVDQFATESEINPDLARQIESLTQFLEQVIARQEEEGVLQRLAEFPELAARAFDEGDVQAQEKVQQKISELSTDEISRLLRYYTVFFHLMNSQEQREISRINRKRAIEMDPDSPRDESIAEAVHFLKEEGYSAEEAAGVIGKLDIQPTITAHPTEARRHSVMLKQQHITKMIEQLRQSELTPDEETARTMDILNEIHLLLATDEVRRGKVTVGDEVENGLFFFTNTIWDAIPQLYDDLRNAFNTYYDEVPDFATIFRYRSWIGSDRDGNPNVTSDVTWDTLMEQRKNVFHLYLEELDKLRRYLSISTTKYDISDELAASLESDRETDPLSERYQRLYTQEPYRRKIVHIIHKLRAQIEVIEQGSRAAIRKQAQQYTAQDFLGELELIVDSLRESGLEEIASVGEI